MTITRPATRTPYALAGLGIAAGFAVGAAGLLAGRKYTDRGIEQIKLRRRLERVDEILGLPN